MKIREDVRKALHKALVEAMKGYGTYSLAMEHLRALSGPDCQSELLLMPVMKVLDELS